MFILKQLKKKNNMKTLNEHLDLNNPAHVIIKEINDRNEKLYGPYHEECGHFAQFCVCLGEKSVRTNKK